MRRDARSAPGQQPDLPAQRRIAVLGAGPMGLAVAYELLQRGQRPVIFEADDRVGGMTACFDFDGLRIERFYHFHCTSDVAFLQMLAELGIESRMRWVNTRMGFWYRGILQPWGNPIALLRFRGLGLLGKLRYGLHAFLSTRREDWSALDRMEATAWIRRWVGEEAFEVLWRRLFELKFHQFAGALSAAWIWSRIRRIGRSRQNLMREKLGYLEGGSDAFLNALRSRIEALGGEIRLSSPVSRVVIEGPHLRGVQTPAGFEPFDLVISTIPLPFVPRVMPDLPAALLARYRALQNIGVVCVIARLRRPVSPNFWLNINDPEMDIPGLVEYSNLRPLDGHVVYVPFYLPGDHPHFQLPDESFIDRVRAYLERINPQLTDRDFLAIRASRYRYAQPICVPGFRERLPDARLPVEGLWAADTSYYYPEDRGISESIAFGRELAVRALSSGGFSRHDQELLAQHGGADRPQHEVERH